MLMIRLKRIGRKHDPSYRIVVTEKSRGPKSGDYIEKVGFYNPQDDTRTIDSERVKHWITNGAQVSPTVHNLLVTEGVIKGKKINVLPQKSPVVSETPEEEAPSATAGEAAPAEEAAEAPAETPEEAPAEETPTEAPTEDAPAETPAEEPAETPVEEPAQTEETPAEALAEEEEKSE